METEVARIGWGIASVVMTLVGDTNEFIILVVIPSGAIQAATSAKVCSCDALISGSAIDMFDETVEVHVVVVFTMQVCIIEGIIGVIGRTTENKIDKLRIFPTFLFNIKNIEFKPMAHL